MPKNIKPIRLSLTGRTYYSPIAVRKGDYDSVVFDVHIIENGLPVNLVDQRIIFECVTPAKTFVRDDGQKYGNIKIIDASQGHFQYTLSNEVFSAVGAVNVAYFAFEESNPDLQNATNRATTQNFIFKVIKSALTDNLNPADYLGDLDALINEINWLKDQYETLNPDNYVTQRELQQLALNVKKAGAMGDYNPADGSGNDDTEAIQLALNNLDVGDTLVFTRGNYKVSADITVPDGVTIKWTKKGHVFVTGGEKGFILGNDCTLKTPHIHETRAYADVPNRTSGVSADGKKNINVVGGIVDKFTFANLKMSAVKVVSVVNTELAEAGTKDDGNGGWQGQGIYITNGSEDISLSRLYVHDNGMHGIQAWAENGVLAVKNITITDCHSHNNGDTGIQLTEVENYIVKGNHCNDNGINGGPYGGQGIQTVSNTSPILTKNGVIEANVVNGNMESGIEAVQTEDLTIANNISKNNAWAGIKAQRDGKYLELSGNTSTHNGTNGIDVSNYYLVKSNHNTTAFNADSGENFAHVSYPFLNNPVALNNGQARSDRAGVLFAACDHAQMIFGHTFDDQDTKTQDYGVRGYQVAGISVYLLDSDGNKVRNLLFDGGTTGIILDNPAMEDIYYGGRTDANGVRELSGTGSPEGIVTAPLGSVFRRIDGGPNETLYVKEKGTDNLGWGAKDTQFAAGTEYRPTNVPPGYQYFDTTINKPIWWSNAKQWVDASGNPV